MNSSATTVWGMGQTEDGDKLCQLFIDLEPKADELTWEDDLILLITLYKTDIVTVAEIELF